MAEEEGVPVDLYIYDLTNGLASVLSPSILGRQVEGVWHTAVVVFGREYFYGGAGITSCSPGGTQLGEPRQVQRLGRTFVPLQVFKDYLHGLATTTYTGSAYRLLEHNCNHFSDEVAQFLCAARVPKHILQQPETDLPPPLRLALQALVDALPPPDSQMYTNGVRRSRQDSPEFLDLNSQIEEARAVSQKLGEKRNTLAEKLARKERRKEKKRKKHREMNGGDAYPEDEMAEAVEVEAAGPSARPLPLEPDEPRPERAQPRDPPILFPDIDGAQEFEGLCKALEGVELSAEEKQSLDELQQYLVHGEGSWVLGDDFLTFIDVQPVREPLGVGVAAVHQRVGGRRPHALQHQGHHQGVRALRAERGGAAAGRGHGAAVQHRHQGGKDRGIRRGVRGAVHGGAAAAGRRAGGGGAVARAGRAGAPGAPQRGRAAAHSRGGPAAQRLPGYEPTYRRTNRFNIAESQVICRVACARRCQLR